MSYVRLLALFFMLPLSWVKGVEAPLEVILVDLRVDLRRVEGLVAENRLNVPHVAPGTQEVRPERMAEAVRRDDRNLKTYAYLTQILVDDRGETVFVRAEDRVAVQPAIVPENRYPSAHKVSSHHVGSVAGKECGTRFPALPLRKVNEPMIEVKIRFNETCRLGDTKMLSCNEAWGIRAGSEAR